MNSWLRSTMWLRPGRSWLSLPACLAQKRELVYKEDGQEYGQVIRMLGNGRLECQCIDGKKRLCHIRGKMRKKVWVGQVRGGKSNCCWPGDIAHHS